MENEDSQQNITLAVIREKLKGIEKSLEKNSEQHKTLFDMMITRRDVDRIIESNNRRIAGMLKNDELARIDIDAHCLRLKEAEQKQAVLDESLKPIFINYREQESFKWALIKMMIGAFTIIGSIAIGIFFYIKGKI